LKNGVLITKITETVRSTKHFQKPGFYISIMINKNNTHPLGLPQFVRTVQKHPYVGNI